MTVMGVQIPNKFPAWYIMAELTRASVMMFPEADHVKTSICPGVSINTYLKNMSILAIFKKNLFKFTPI